MKKATALQELSKAHGGELQKTRAGRAQGRPLTPRTPIQLTLRSSQAKGAWSFSKPANQEKIKAIVDKFATKYNVKVFSLAAVGNYLHFHIQLSNINKYPAFIRALTAATAMAVTGANRWKPMRSLDSSGKTKDLNKSKKLKHTPFWDYRPFTQVVSTKGLNEKDYTQINQLEGQAMPKKSASYLIRRGKLN